VTVVAVVAVTLAVAVVAVVAVPVVAVVAFAASAAVVANVVTQGRSTAHPRKSFGDLFGHYLWPARETTFFKS
jgi:hypothetical protein